MDYKKINYEKMLWILISIFSLYVSIAVGLDNDKPTYYEWLPLLPLSYAIINFLSVGLYRGILNFSENLAKLIIHVFFFIRQSLAIFFLYVGGYVSTLNKLTPENVNSGIALMIFETIFAYLMLNIYTRKKIYLWGTRKVRLKNGLYRSLKLKVVGLILTGCVIFCVGAYFTSPLIQRSYSSIWNPDLMASDAYYLAKIEARVGSMDRILFTLFNVVFDFTRILFPCWLLFELKKHLGDRFICILIGALLCFMQLLMILNENMYILITILITGIYLIKIYPKYRRFMIRVLSIAGVIIVAFFFLSVAARVSISQENYFSTFSDMFQIYFPGISNIACGFNIVDDNVASTLFFDIYEAIPFHNTLFGLSGIRLSDIYNSCNGVKYTICPGIIQAYHYLGFLAPIVTCVIIKIALDSQEKLNNAKDLFSYAAYALLTVYSAMTPVCYYPTVLLSRFLSTILPMLIISKFAGRNYSFAIIEDRNEEKIG